MRTNYERGRALEYSVLTGLRSMGYIAVRNAGSHGAWDITAVNGKRVLLVQVKAHGKVDAEARRVVSAVPGPPCVIREIWERIDRGWKVETLDGPK
jgi:hypothetical protein